MMTENDVQYKSFLLRLWRDAETADKPWRATIECVTEERERRHFADVDSLLLFLLAEMGGDHFSINNSQ